MSALEQFEQYVSTSKGKIDLAITSYESNEDDYLTHVTEHTESSRRLMTSEDSPNRDLRRAMQNPTFLTRLKELQAILQKIQEALHSREQSQSTKQGTIRDLYARYEVSLMQYNETFGQVKSGRLGSRDSQIGPGAVMPDPEHLKDEDLMQAGNFSVPSLEEFSIDIEQVLSDISGDERSGGGTKGKYSSIVV